MNGFAGDERESADEFRRNVARNSNSNSSADPFYPQKVIVAVGAALSLIFLMPSGLGGGRDQDRPSPAQSRTPSQDASVVYRFGGGAAGVPVAPLPR